jgi:predicted RNase H-like HicB family nuclease
VTRYAVVIESAEDGGYGAWCPDLPGCVALAGAVRKRQLDGAEEAEHPLGKQRGGLSVVRRQ